MPICFGFPVALRLAQLRHSDFLEAFRPPLVPNQIRAAAGRDVGLRSP